MVCLRAWEYIDGFISAIDMARDPLEILGACVELGVHYVLTSGGSATAVSAKSILHLSPSIEFTEFYIRKDD